MARPLPEDRIKKMDLPVKIYNGETKKLGKQIGVARYIIDEQTHEAVNLSETADKRGDGLLILEDHGKDKPVIKIVENLFHTKDKPYAYVLDKDGKVVFLEKDISVYDTNTDVKNAEEAINEINNIPAGETGGVDINGGAEFTSPNNLAIDDNRNITVNVNGTLTIDKNSASIDEGSILNANAETLVINDGSKINEEVTNSLNNNGTTNITSETANIGNFGLNNNGVVTLSISEGGSFGTESISTSGDNAKTTIQQGGN